MLKSLHARHHQLATQARQLETLENGLFSTHTLPRFREKIGTFGFSPLRPAQLDIFQVNVGYQCNQVCKHCHVDAGPDRTESMSRETMEVCLDVIEKHGFATLDITGGAPEMHPHFRWFVEEARKRTKGEIIVRSNLTIILANPKYDSLPVFFKENNVRVCSSLPFYQKDRTDRQRGDGVFDKSIKAIKKLNAVGYGIEGTGLVLDLVFNPTGAFLPAGQQGLERDFKTALWKEHEVVFNNLLTIANVPVSRFLDFLLESGNYEGYMQKLVDAFNPATVDKVMCRNTLSVDWQGYLYDCDFNQMLGMKLNGGTGSHIKDFDMDALMAREIKVSQHCYACTAGTGSSCQGATI